jgi:hypothetical protein
VPCNCDETHPIGSAESGSCADYRGHGETSPVEISTPGASSIEKVARRKEMVLLMAPPD